MKTLQELTPRGRLGRAGFWGRHLTVVPLALWVVIAAGSSPGAPYDLPLAMLLVAILISIWGRRLHDRGRSCWWLLAAFVPVVGAVALIVECGFRGSESGDGRYGATRSTHRADYLRVDGSGDHLHHRP